MPHNVLAYLNKAEPREKDKKGISDGKGKLINCNWTDSSMKEAMKDNLPLRGYAGEVNKVVLANLHLAEKFDAQMKETILAQ